MPHDPLRAATYVLAAMAIIGWADNLVVQIAEHIGLWQFHVMRAAMALTALMVVAVTLGLALRPVRPSAVLVRSLLLAGAMVFYFGALSAMTVAQAVAGLFTAPVFVLVISTLLFRARPKRDTAFAACLGFGGALCVLQPDVSALDAQALMPVASGVLYAMSAVATRRICAKEGVLTLLSGFFAAMLVLSGVALIGLAGGPGGDSFLTRSWQAPSGTALALTAVQTAVALIGIGLITKAYLLAEAPHVAVFEYSLLVFAALWGWVLWGDRLTALAAFGIALILLSGGLLFRSETRRVAAP